MTDEEKILLSFLEEKARTCDERQMITRGNFIDMHSRSLAASLRLPEGVKRIFWGVFPSAERTVPLFLPAYIDASDENELAEYFAENEDDCPLSVLEITKDKFSKPLSHRDYLGALMGLGINRDVTGDIKVTADGCYIAVLKSMSEYIAQNMGKAGRGSLKIKIISPADVPETGNDAGEEISFTVSSVRLDSVVKNGFGISRESACEAIEHGLVFINDIECFKPDKRVTEGDKITLRHKGRMIISDCSSKSKKGRIIVKAFAGLSK